MQNNEELKKEAQAFDDRALERINNGFVPDMRNLKKVDWFYNNPWREPEFARIKWFPTLNAIIAQACQSGIKVLEVGCGTGMLSLELARNGLDVTGLDLSSKSIEVADQYRKKSENDKGFGSLKYICGDFLPERLKPNSFDSVVFFRSLHHFPNTDKVIKKSADVLTKKGQLLLCEPIRSQFSHNSAQVALILRLLSPTWQESETKLNKDWNKDVWDEMVEEIYKEYIYEDHHHQSVMDNSTNSAEEILKSLEIYFDIDTLEYSDAFIDKLIGGLRGENRFKIARFLKFLDDYMVKKKILPPTSMTLFANKK